ncbi:variable surface lipoprotein [Gigaspora margarita]|uniref:Variable surface lipoprotein n=1 Tax=Gigaspora margarita TaxID=4874 RepID=A0A8H3XJT3_GIGMA|nr:variable surface lipoprotein [Gigaspora margarita]
MTIENQCILAIGRKGTGKSSTGKVFGAPNIIPEQPDASKVTVNDIKNGSFYIETPGFDNYDEDKLNEIKRQILHALFDKGIDKITTILWFVDPKDGTQTSWEHEAKFIESLTDQYDGNVWENTIIVTKGDKIENGPREAAKTISRFKEGNNEALKDPLTKTGDFLIRFFESLPTNSDEGLPANNDEGLPANNDEGLPTNSDECSPTNSDEGSPTNNDEDSPTNNDEGSPTNDDEGSPTNDDESLPTNNDEGLSTNNNEEGVLSDQLNEAHIFKESEPEKIIAEYVSLMKEHASSPIKFYFSQVKCKRCPEMTDPRLAVPGCHSETEDCHGEIENTHQGEIINQHPNGLQDYHPGSLKVYHPGSPTNIHPGKSHDNELDSSFGASIVRILSLGIVSKKTSGFWECCQKQLDSEGCKKVYTCCEKNNDGCQQKYDCCECSPDNNGCEKKFGCCDESYTNKGCQSIYEICKHKVDEDTCIMVCKECEQPANTKGCKERCKQCKKALTEKGCSSIPHEFICN